MKSNVSFESAHKSQHSSKSKTDEAGDGDDLDFDDDKKFDEIKDRLDNLENEIGILKIRSNKKPSTLNTTRTDDSIVIS